MHLQINYIWIFQSLILQFVYYSLLRTILYQSNHKMILLLLDKHQLIDASFDTHYNHKQYFKTKFNYNITQLNKYWDILRDLIIKTARSTIPNHKVSSNSSQRLPSIIVNHNHKVKLISNIYYYFHKKNIDQQSWPSPSQ